MSNRFDLETLTAIELRIALDETYPESNYGAIPVIDQRDALEAYLAFDDGALDEVPLARDAYVSHQLQHIY